MDFGLSSTVAGRVWAVSRRLQDARVGLRENVVPPFVVNRLINMA
jgi:hypothetical protein